MVLLVLPCMRCKATNGVLPTKSFKVFMIGEL